MILIWYEQLVKEVKIKPPEKIAVSYWIEDNIKYIISQNEMTKVFFLYEKDIKLEKFIKTAFKAKNPNDLEKKMNLKRM